jgi:methionyl-tRNA formyltransferase|tara:strand:- start:2683 stop:3306 length:624 start_codon:yes stop_codon:yes gene_type:complete
LCSDPAHPVIAWLERWAADNDERADISILQKSAECEGGDFLFLISCHQIIGRDIRDRYRYALVIHASDLPTGRGWSPMAWEILHGADNIVVSLLNAEDGVDSGAIWQKRRFALDGSELLDELNAKLFEAELELMSWALENCAKTSPRAQEGEATTYPRRTPQDSQIDPNRPLFESFDTIRIADPDRFPAFFTLRGATYKIRLEKLSS